MRDKMNRRNFIKWSFLCGAAATLASCGLLPSEKKDPADDEKEEQQPGKDKDPSAEKEKEEEKDEQKDKKEKDDHPVPRRRLGKTGEYVSVLGLGGAIAVAGDRLKAEEIINRALDLGINYLDTAASYGASESNLGQVMRHRREDAFLASKTEQRTYDGAMREFERSLERLQTDYLDLYQLHGIHHRGDLERVHREGGAMEAVLELKEQGLVRFTGITAHKNAPLLKEALQEFPFDCVLLSLNAGDVHYDSMIKEVMPAARDKDTGIIAMKVAAYDGRIFREGGIESMEQALGYVLTHPVSTAIVGIDTVAQLEENVQIAREFEPFSDRRMQKLEELTKPYQREVNFFKHEW